jgi:hypothetical protein
MIGLFNLLMVRSFSIEGGAHLRAAPISAT